MSDPVNEPPVRPASTIRKVRTHGADATEALAAQLAPNLPADVTLGLRGPLGAGKTCFVRGLAKGLGIAPRQVASPTFVYLVDYESDNDGRLHHGDLYRLGEVPEEAREEVFESIGLLDAVLGPEQAVVEWWEHYRGPSPSCLVDVEFVIENAEDRAITLTFTGAGLEAAARSLGESDQGE